MKHLPLFTRYWLLLAALVTVPIVLAACVETWSVYRAHYLHAEERELLLARLASQVIEGVVKPPIERLVITANVPWDYPSATDHEFLMEAVRTVRQFPLIERIQRLEQGGRVLQSHGPDGEARTISAAEIDQLKNVRPIGAAHEPSPMPVARGNAGAWSVAIPERGTGRIVLADLRTETITSVVRDIQHRKDDLVFLVDRDGIVLSHPDISLLKTSLYSLPGWKTVPDLGRVLNDTHLTEINLGEISVKASLDPAMGDLWFGAVHRIEPVGWTVFALEPSSAWHAELRANVSRMLVVLLAANIVALLLAWGLARHISRPLESLAAASQRVAMGDLTAHAEIVSDDQVARVSRQFNAMVDELHRSYTELERRVAEKTAELEQANRHKSEFLAQMSHELRTPLNAVIGFSDALNAEYFGALNDKQREYVRDIHASGQHLLALINDLLDLAKIEAGRMDVVLEPVDVRRVVDSAMALVRGRAEARGIALESSVAPDVHSWPADERKLRQVLLNLLSNAVKFTPDAGRVTLHAALAQPGPGAHGRPTLEFAITDTGIGIPPDQVSKLFTDFGQIARQESSMREGTGLGLALSRRLVELHGGVIWAESQPGQGSTFYFTLPGPA